MAFSIEFAKSVKKQIRQLTADKRALLIDAIEKQLSYEPMIETRNRKPLRPNPIAPWELRVENMRVFFEISSEEPNVVHVLAVGEKKGNKLMIAGKEVQL
jgi:mRNA-degrading endonuclease RelE of RelBE toxin-antitoxin system